MNADIHHRSIVFVAIYEAESVTDFVELDEEQSVPAKVARGRGSGTLIGDSSGAEETTTSQPENTDINAGLTQRDRSYQMEFEDGKLKLDTGYVMRFVPRDLLDLSVFDIISVPDLMSYPVPEETLDSLPAIMKGYLKERGYVKIHGVYRDCQFYGVQHGWDYDQEDETNPIDRLAKLLHEMDSEEAALDYFYIEEGPDRYGIEEMAEIRGVQPGSIDESVRRARTQLEE